MNNHRLGANTINLEVYDEMIHHKGFSVFSGGKETEGFEHYKTGKIADTPLIRAFLEDDDIQQITITSTNIGFSRTYTKRFKKNHV